MSLIKNVNSPIPSSDKGIISNSSVGLEDFFIQSLREMYYAECQIAKKFDDIIPLVKSPILAGIIKNHFRILLKHKERLERIFLIKNQSVESKNCKIFDALLAEGLSHLSLFSNDIVNWEIALILVSQKLAHYKIASYGGLAHLAINLNYYKAATLLAFSAQEEEEYITNNLNGIIDAFLNSHVEGYKN